MELEDGKSAGGGGDPHELMTGALLVKYGSKGGTRRIPKLNDLSDFQTPIRDFNKRN